MNLLAWIWQPIAPPLQITACAVVLSSLAIFAYARTFTEHRVASSLLLLMRLGIVITLAILLMGPSWMPPQAEEEQRPKLTVLVDTSQSMLTEDSQTNTRIGLVKSTWLSRDQINELTRDFSVDLYAFDDKTRPAVPSTFRQEDEAVASGRTTQLTQSVTSILSRLTAGEDGAAMLVISDGRDTEDAPIQPAAALAAAKQIPVYTVGIGGRRLQPDLALLAVPMQEYLLPNEPGAILAKVYQVGLDQATTTVRIKRGAWEHTVPVAFNHQSVVEVQLPITHEEEGEYEYEIEVETVDGEAETTNNAQTVFAHVQKRRIRVLVLEGQPYWDSKFLAQSLRKDERVELTQITQLSADKRETIITRVEGDSSTLPTTAEGWSEYDVVVLGQAIENILDADSADHLAGFVGDHGGSVIFARGTPCNIETPEGQAVGDKIAPLEPVVWGAGFVDKSTITPTPAGRIGHWFSTIKMGLDVDEAFARLPGFAAMPIVEREKAATIVLARASSTAAQGDDSSQPAIVAMSYGRGRVVGVLGEGTWRWSLLKPESDDLRGFYDTFWSNMVRWLAMGGDFQPGQQLSLDVSRSSARLQDPVTVDVICKVPLTGGATPRLTLKTPDGSSTDVAMHLLPGRNIRFRATLEPSVVGVHEVSVHAPGLVPERLGRKFNVYDLNVERLQTSANPMPLRVLAEHSGGQYFEADQYKELPKILRRHRASMLVPPRLEYIWDQWFVMCLMLVWTGVEWIGRRTVDLL